MEADLFVAIEVCHKYIRQAAISFRSRYRPSVNVNPTRVAKASAKPWRLFDRDKEALCGLLIDKEETTPLWSHSYLFENLKASLS